MPIEEIIEFGLRLSADVAIDSLQVIGSGDKRSAAVARAFVFAVLVVTIAAALFWLLPSALATGGGPLLASGVLALIGGYLCVRIVGEARRLQHWGEPELTASPIGLTIVRRDAVIHWGDIVSVTPQRRGGRKSVRIGVPAEKGRAVYIASERPEDLAATILAEKRKREPMP